MYKPGISLAVEFTRHDIFKQFSACDPKTATKNHQTSKHTSTVDLRGFNFTKKPADIDHILHSWF